MLNQIIDLVRKHAGEGIINNPAIPNEKNEAAIQAASGSINNGLGRMLASGNLKDILRMFAGAGGGSSLLTQTISGDFMKKLMTQFGLNQQQASQVSGQVIPGTLNEMVRKTNDPTDKSFNIQDIFNNISGGRTSNYNMQNLLDKVRAGKVDLDGDGDMDIQDLTSLFKGGGFLQKLKGLFSK